MTSSPTPPIELLGEGSRFDGPGVDVPEEALHAQLTQADPALSDFAGAVEAYDAVISAALAAVVAADDGAASIAFVLVTVTAGDAHCGSYGECGAALGDGFTIGYQAITASAKP